VKIVKGDMVKVISGDSKGTVSKVLKVFPEKNRLIVEQVNIVKRHTKPTQRLPQGGIVEREATIHVSNVMIIDPKGGAPTRIGSKVLADGKRARMARRSGEIIRRPEE
jgi:large subunit ribosomal protein L24